MSETVFTYAAPRLKFGPGAIAEIGHDVAALGALRVLVVTDAGIAAAGHPERVALHAYWSGQARQGEFAIEARQAAPYQPPGREGGDQQ